MLKREKENKKYKKYYGIRMHYSTTENSEFSDWLPQSF